MTSQNLIQTLRAVAFWLISSIICILLFKYLPIRDNFPCDFNEIWLLINSNSLLYEVASNKSMKQKLVLVKINLNMPKKIFLVLFFISALTQTSWIFYT